MHKLADLMMHELSLQSIVGMHLDNHVQRIHLLVYGRIGR